MSPRRNDRLETLRAHCEVASGRLRETALAVEEIAENLPEHGNKARKAQLSKAAGRIIAAANSLVAEAAADSVPTTSMASRIARQALSASVLLVSSSIGGLASGGAEGVYSYYFDCERVASAALDGVERSVSDARPAAPQPEWRKDLEVLRREVLLVVSLEPFGSRTHLIGPAAMLDSGNPQPPLRVLAQIDQLLADMAEVAVVESGSENEAPRRHVVALQARAAAIRVEIDKELDAEPEP